MSISTSRTSVAVFATGLVFMLVGAFTLGVSIAPDAEAAKTRWATVSLNYLAPKIPGLSDDASCGQATGKMVGWPNDVYGGPHPIYGTPSTFSDVVACRADLRIVP